MNFFAALSIYYSLLPLSKSLKLWNLMHKIPIWSKACARDTLPQILIMPHLISG